MKQNTHQSEDPEWADITDHQGGKHLQLIKMHIKKLL